MKLLWVFATHCMFNRQNRAHQLLQVITGLRLIEAICNLLPLLPPLFTRRYLPKASAHP